MSRAETSTIFSPYQRFKPKNVLAILIFASIFLSILASEVTRGAAIESVSAAYITVSSFVAVTLAFFYVLESYFNISFSSLITKRSYLTVPIASIIGALPGCGGAILVVTQYAAGRISFGALVATLTATMGDAAFLLIANRPVDASIVIGIQIVVGILSGYAVDAIYKKKPELIKNDYAKSCSKDKENNNKKGNRLSLLNIFWLALMPVGVLLGILNAIQVDANELLRPLESTLMIKDVATAIGFVGGMLCLLMWLGNFSMGISHNMNKEALSTGKLRIRLINDTNFVTFWVIIAFLVFEVSSDVFAWDLGLLFTYTGALLPFIAILIGFIPGCGPQILVTSLYIADLVPLSSQIGNAISNDGDALFPAIAMSPKAAMTATIVSSIPAFIAAYGYMLLFEL